MPGRKQGDSYPKKAKVTKYSTAFRIIGVPFDNKATLIVKMLEKDGRTEGSICYAIFREQEKLREHRGTKEFWKVFGEAVNKWSWAKDDPRWEDYKKKKFQQDKAKQYQNKTIKEKTYKKPVENNLPGFIYFIQGECGGPIKIGYTTDIKQRITTLQTGYPDRLELLLAFPGKPEYEKAIHKQLEPFRLNGEWYKPSQEVLKKIKDFALLNAYVSAKGGDMMQIRCSN